MLWAAILAGGAGTRFWPESRRANPKQFLTVFGKKTLLEETIDRISPVIPRSRILVITQKAYTARVRKLTGLPPSQILGEPIGRNTAPCAVVSAEWVMRRDPKGVLAILPSDNQIKKTKIFRKALLRAGKICEKNPYPLTFGIRPSIPHTGYGYLEMGQALPGNKGIFYLKRFHEKPTPAKARKYLKSGNVFWNSGMFVWNAQAIERSARKYQPKIHAISKRIMDGNFEKNFKKLYPEMPSISIDYGFMEPMRGNILTLPLDIGWSDLGGWLAYADLKAKDLNQNTCDKNAVFIRSQNNILKTDKRMLALVGVKDLIVIDTPDALLVCHKDKAEHIREVVDWLKKNKAFRYL